MDSPSKCELAPRSLEYAGPMPRPTAPARCTAAFVAALLFLLGALFGTVTAGLHNDYPFLPAAWVLAIPATLLTALALPRFHSRSRGGGITRAAVILWIIGASITGLAAYSERFGEDPHVTTRRWNYCISRLDVIGQYMLEYAANHGGKYPDSLADLLRSSPDLTTDQFLCAAVVPYWTPAGSRDQMIVDLETGKNQHHVYLAKGLTDQCPRDMVLAHDNPSNWVEHEGGITVLFADGVVRHLDRGAATKLLAELSTGHNPPRPNRFTRPR